MQCVHLGFSTWIYRSLSLCASSYTLIYVCVFFDSGYIWYASSEEKPELEALSFRKLLRHLMGNLFAWVWHQGGVSCAGSCRPVWKGGDLMLLSAGFCMEKQLKIQFLWVLLAFPGWKVSQLYVENCLGSWGTSTIHIDSLPHCSWEGKPALPSDPTPVWLKTEEQKKSGLGLGNR